MLEVHLEEERFDDYSRTLNAATNIEVLIERARLGTRLERQLGLIKGALGFVQLRECSYKYSRV